MRVWGRGCPRGEARWPWVGVQSTCWAVPPEGRSGRDHWEWGWDKKGLPVCLQEAALPGFGVPPNGVTPAASPLPVESGTGLIKEAPSLLWAAPSPSSPRLQVAARTQTPPASPQQASDTGGFRSAVPAPSGPPESSAQCGRGAAHREQPRSSPRSYNDVALSCMLPAVILPVFPGKMKTGNGF